MSNALLKNLRQTISTGELVITPLPDCPEISLHLISHDYPRGKLDYDEMVAIMNQPAYWSFCWASGQVLAKYLKQRPEICVDKTILDLGTGSGVAAIAAAMSGASTVYACDTDPLAIEATRVNAQLNGVTLNLIESLSDCPKVDLILAADVLYDRDNLELLDSLPKYADELLIADSRIRDETVFSDYEKWLTTTSSTIPDLDELKEYGEVTLYYRTF